MKTLIIIVVALVLGTLLMLFAMDDPGVVVLARAPHRVELPLALFAVILAAAFALLYLLFNLLFDFFATPKKIKKWNARRRNQKAQTDTLRGYAQLIEGDWKHGEKQLTRRMEDSKTPLLNFLGAAYAAQQQNNFDKRDYYLDQAQSIDPSNRMAVDLTRARLLAQAGQSDEAKQLLETMHPLAPANKTIMRLMVDVYRQSGDMPALSALLPKLEKFKAIPAEQCAELDVLCRQQATEGLASTVLISQSNDSNATPKQLVKEWRGLSSAQKKAPPMVLLYAQKLIAAGGMEEAEVMLRKALQATWTDELAALYGLAQAKDLRKQISFATTMLSEHEDDDVVHLTLARLNMAAGEIDKAVSYYQQAIKLGASDEAYYELGEYFEEQGDRKAALGLYKKGVQASISMGAGLSSSVDAAASASEAMELDSIITPGIIGLGAHELATNNVTEAVVMLDDEVKNNVIDLPLVEAK